MSKHESKKPKSHEQFPKTEKSQRKINLAIIETSPSFPIQEVLCREEHKKLFEDLWESPS